MVRPVKTCNYTINCFIYNASQLNICVARIGKTMSDNLNKWHIFNMNKNKYKFHDKQLIHINHKIVNRLGK